MSPAAIVLAGVFAGLVAELALAWMLSYGRRLLPLDHPNARSLHGQPIPRTGGVAIMAGALPAIAYAGPPFLLLAGLALGLCAVSLIDDFRGLHAGLRFAAHLGAAALAVVVPDPAVGVPAAIALTVAIAWMTNLYNFMDGSDGLAGGMTVFGFAAYAIAALLAGHAAMGAVAVALVCGALAFLTFNFHPARIFMGDSGSVPIGFLAAALGLDGVRQGLWPGWFPLLVFAPFVVDATVTLLRRALRGERVWQAHRSHYYQRLVRSGAGHRGTALAEYILMAACAGSAVAALYLDAVAQTVLLVLWAAIFLVLAVWVDRRWARHQESSDVR